MPASPGAPASAPKMGGRRGAWMAHVKATMRANKGKSLKQVLKLAKKTYKKSHRGGASITPAPALGGQEGGRTRRRRGPRRH